MVGRGPESAGGQDVGAEVIVVKAGQDAMPPPAGGVTSEQAAAQMAFRRRASSCSNTSMEGARMALVRAFDAADLDNSGMVNKEELAAVIKNHLHIQLQDPVNDIDIIFDSLDEDKSGMVSMDEFCKLFEPTIIRRSSSSATASVDIDDVMKETFSSILVDSKMERGVVIQGFMRAQHEIEKAGRGFGKAYWGSKWRFKVFDGFYTHPKDPATGMVVDVARRFYHLKERLEKASKGQDPWLNKQYEDDPDISKEIKDRTVVEDYCKIWLRVLEDKTKEVEDAWAARRAAQNV